MPKEQDLLQLLGEPSSPFGDYVRYIVNGGLGRYKVIEQTGAAKQGQSLYTHVVNGVAALEVVRHLLSLDDLAARCLFLAYTVHDLNKLPEWGDRIAYKDLATRVNIGRELERIGANEFLPNWRNYLADITALCHLHQGHLAVDVTGLDRRERREYQLGWDHVSRLGCLMRAADVLDLSHELDEARHKETFLRELNAAAGSQRYSLVHHRLAENRGILANLIHQSVVEYLHRRLGAAPHLHYPEGTVYLLAAGSVPEWTCKDDAAVTLRVEESLRRVQGRAVRQFVKRAQNGYRVDAAALESGVAPQSIMAIIREDIEPRAYGESFRRGEGAPREDSVRRDLKAALSSLGEAERAEVDQLLAEPNLLPDEGHLRVGELTQGYVNFLKAHRSVQLTALKETAWQRAYRLLALPPSRQPIHEAVNSFHRAYFMSRDTAVSLDELTGKIEKDLEALGANESTPSGQAFVGSYLRDTLSFSFAPPPLAAFAAALQRYEEDQHTQCCYCGSAYATEKLMALSVPPNVGVQAFSNRLAGGGGEPKRRVCPVCRTQFILEKLAWASHQDKRGEKQATFYLHLFPYGFFTEPFLDAWRREVQHLLSEDVSAACLDTVSWLQEWRQGGSPGVRFSRTKANGLALPRPETASNTPVLPINAPGDGYSNQLLLALQYAVVLARFFGCRLILSRTAVPILPPTGFAALFVDGAPSVLGWLLHGHTSSDGNLDEARVAALMRRLAGLGQLHRLLWDRGRNRNLILELARAANDNPLALFFVADRALAEKSAETQRELQLTVDCMPYLEEIMEHPMTQLQTLAQMAVEGAILGGSGPFARRPRSALLKPLDILFAVAQQHPGASPADVYAASAEEVFSHLQRVAADEYRPGATKEEKVGRYVRQFLEGVLTGMYGGDLNRLLSDERFVRSAYVWYVRQALAARGGERTSQAEPTGNAEVAR